MSYKIAEDILTDMDIDWFALTYENLPAHFRILPAQIGRVDRLIKNHCIMSLIYEAFYKTYFIEQ